MQTKIFGLALEVQILFMPHSKRSKILCLIDAKNVIFNIQGGYIINVRATFLRSDFGLFDLESPLSLLRPCYTNEQLKTKGKTIFRISKTLFHFMAN
ncbi:MAG: hypothetical protein OT643_03175 [Bacteroidetes bacterium]|nr:hypothetical protein [Sphingobacteriales bacterium]MDA0197766.1 hypothetical protein [Bacteroidota bacterium]